MLKIRVPVYVIFTVKEVSMSNGTFFMIDVMIDWLFLVECIIYGAVHT